MWRRSAAAKQQPSQKNFEDTSTSNSLSEPYVFVNRPQVAGRPASLHPVLRYLHREDHASAFGVNAELENVSLRCFCSFCLSVGPSTAIPSLRNQESMTLLRDGFTCYVTGA